MLGKYENSKNSIVIMAISCSPMQCYLGIHNSLKKYNHLFSRYVTSFGSDVILQVTGLIIDLPQYLKGY